MPNRRAPAALAPPADRPVVYLAGPISGCNWAQRTEWRRWVTENASGGLAFIDPVDTPVDRAGETSRFEIARQDTAAIRACDAVLANMWKESIGTAIGVVEARRAGKIVVLVDQNHIQSGFLAYFADAVAHSVQEGIAQTAALLEVQRVVEYVEKSDGVTQEPFSREKLARSLRAACTAASRNDVLCAPEIIPRVMRTILSPAVHRSGVVKSSALREAIFAALEELEADELRGAEFSGIREAWERHRRRERSHSNPDIIGQLRAAYEGEDWQGRIAAETAISGSCPMNALLLCTKFEEAWVAVARELGMEADGLHRNDPQFSGLAFHAIGVAEEELRRRSMLSARTTPLVSLLVLARRDRNAIVHDNGFTGDRAKRVLGAWKELLEIREAIERVPEVKKAAKKAKKTKKTGVRA